MLEANGQERHGQQHIKSQIGIDTGHPRKVDVEDRIARDEASWRYQEGIEASFHGLLSRIHCQRL